jgi:dTDP-glucose 4,6-dehydratase
LTYVLQEHAFAAIARTKAANEEQRKGEEMYRKIVVTGGAGFMGSNFVHFVLDNRPQLEVVVLDKLTYAGNLDNLKDTMDNRRFTFIKGDICDASAVHGVAADADAIINFAADTHVDRSIESPGTFVMTDVYGTFVLLEAAKHYGHARYVQISTDEVYGSIEEDSFHEASKLNPSSPYSASKAGADHLVKAYCHTYGLDAVIVRASNNYGPYQYPEKVIPLFITNAIDDEPLPLYGDGSNVRDWLYVEDFCRAVDTALYKGVKGTIYNVASGNEITNLELTRGILREMGKPETLIKRVRDRPGHDRRYSMTASLLRSLGWQPAVDLAEGLARTVAWYRKNEWWWRKIKSGEFREYYRRMYESR